MPVLSEKKSGKTVHKNIYKNQGLTRPHTSNYLTQPFLYTPTGQKRMKLAVYFCVL